MCLLESFKEQQSSYKIGPTLKTDILAQSEFLCSRASLLHDIHGLSIVYPSAFSNMFSLETTCPTLEFSFCLCMCVFFFFFFCKFVCEKQKQSNYHRSCFDLQ